MIWAKLPEINLMMMMMTTTMTMTMMMTMMMLMLTDDDGQSGVCDVSERVRQLNDELANEPPLPTGGPSQSSVQFKEKLVDFISPTPEPALDSSEEDATTPQATPRDDESKQEDSCPESASATADPPGIPTSTNNETSAVRERFSPTADGSQNYSTFPSVSPSEVEPTESLWQPNSAERRNRQVSKKSPPKPAKTKAVSSSANTGSRSAASAGAATVETDSKTTDGDKSSGSSDHGSGSARRHSLLAAKVVGFLGKSAAGSTPRFLEVKPVEPSIENRPSDDPGAASSTLPAATAAGSSGNPPVGGLRPKSAETAREVGPSQAKAKSELEDMALVERGGRYRMISVSELTSLQQKRRPVNSSRTPRSPTQTARTPSTSSTHNPRLVTLTMTVVFIFTRVRTIVQKSDSPIVDSIGQNNRPMRWRCVSFSASITVKQ